MWMTSQWQWAAAGLVACKSLSKRDTTAGTCTQGEYNFIITTLFICLYSLKIVRAQLTWLPCSESSRAIWSGRCRLVTSYQAHLDLQCLCYYRVGALLSLSFSGHGTFDTIYYPLSICPISYNWSSIIYVWLGASLYLEYVLFRRGGDNSTILRTLELGLMLAIRHISRDENWFRGPFSGHSY